MEKIAYEIQDLLQEKLSCYRQLCLVLDKEKKAIGSIDLDTLWETTKSKKEMTSRIEGLRNSILSLLRGSFLDMDMDVNTFSLAFLVNNLPLSDRTKSGLRKIKSDIDRAKDQVVHQAKANQIQVRKYLSVVDDIMSVVGDNSSQAQYTGAGVIPGQKKNNCLFRAEV
ncbi:MAG: flagellar export chaperone FlgN [Desulfobacterales bacterium]|nr:flagellar export chaperone FlgN [Desulfobacterales bacterium]